MSRRATWLLLAASLVASPALAATAEPYASCAADAEVPAAERATLGRAATTFMEALLAGRTAEAYGMMGLQAKARATPQQFANAAPALQKMGPFGALKAEHVYLIKTGGPLPSMVCGKPGASDAWVRVRTSGAPRQAYVLMSGLARDAHVAINVRLEPEGETWKVLDFALNGDSTAGRDARQFLALGRAQAGAGHAFNAALLLSTARQLAQRGPNLQLGLAEIIEHDIAVLQPPPELSGKPPLTWTLGGTLFQVTGLTAAGMGERYVLMLEQRPTPWPGEVTAERQNRALIEAFLKVHPETREAFDGVLVQSVKPDGSGAARTLYDTRKGYAPIPVR